MKRRMAVLSVLGMLPWAGLNAQQTATTTFKVTAEVEEYCDVSAPDLALRSHTAQLRATCTPNTTYDVGLARGAARGAPSGHASGANTVTGVGTGRAVDHTVFGGVPAIRVAPAGGNADAVTVHIYY